MSAATKRLLELELEASAWRERAESAEQQLARADAELEKHRREINRLLEKLTAARAAS